MKKLGIILLAFFFLIGVITPMANAAEIEADFCKQFKGQSKIWWDGMELKSGQIGKLTILKDTQLYKLDGENKKVSRILKAGESYRIYAFKPGKLSVGGGYYVDRDTKVKYQTPSKTKLNAVKCINQPVTTPTVPKEEPGKEPAPSEVQDQHDVISDARDSVAAFLGLSNGFLVYDKVTQKHVHIPYKLNSAGAYFLAKDALYVHVGNHRVSSLDYNDLYRIELREPFKVTKVLSGILNASTNGEHLYYFDLKTEPTPDGYTIETGMALYQTDLDGNLVNTIAQVEGLFSRMVFKNGYIFAAKHDGTILRSSVENGETEEMAKPKYRTSSYGNEEQEAFYYWDELKSQQQMVFDAESQQTFTFEGPYKMLAKVYGNKLYYVSENDTLYVVENQSKATKVLTSTNGTIIAFDDDYLICYDIQKDKISKVKFR